MEVILFYVLAYLLGSIPFGLILTKIAGEGDLRKIGSGNIGATNVLRTGNKLLAFFTLILDGGKVALAIYFLSLTSLNKPEYTGLLLFGLLGVIGHCYPIWLKFKGGKGVATTLGTLLAAVPLAGIAACLTWLVTAFIFKMSSLSALVAMVVAPLVVFFVYGTAPAVICILISALVFWKHRENIQRLIKGEEPKISLKKKEQ